MALNCDGLKIHGKHALVGKKLGVKILVTKILGVLLGCFKDPWDLLITSSLRAHRVTSQDES